MLLDTEKKPGIDLGAESEGRIDETVEQKVETASILEAAAPLTPAEAIKLAPDLSLENKVVQTPVAKVEQTAPAAGAEVRVEVTEDEAKAVLNALIDGGDPANMEQVSQNYSQ